MNPTQIAAAFLIAAFSISIAAISPQAHGQTVPSRPGIDAPQLAPLGPHQVGVRTLTLVQPKQADITDINPKTGKPTLKDRTLVVDIWYPANPAVDAKLETYRAEFRGEPPPAPVCL